MRHHIMINYTVQASLKEMNEQMGHHSAKSKVELEDAACRQGATSRERYAVGMNEQNRPVKIGSSYGLCS
jgi:hypothetical protein